MRVLKWIIDTDPGIDDAAAITAMVRGGADIIGLTAVHGNSPLRHTERNARLVVELLGARIPVFAGAERALLEPPRHAPEVHGEDGFGNTFLPEPGRPLERQHAVDFILESADRHAGELRILALGPLTNLALAIAKDRGVAGKIDRIVCMGGTSDARGNATPVSEFNIHADPEAAAVVLESGIPVTLVPWEPTVQALVRPEELEPVASSDRPLARIFTQATRLLADLIEHHLGAQGLILPDLVAAAVALDPDTVTEKVEAHVTVETGGRVARGLTAVDYQGFLGKPATVTVVLRVDRRRIADLLVRSFTA